MKRGFGRVVDIAGAGLGLLLLAPVLAVVAVAVRVVLGSPILFRQQRPGLYERPFMLLKFRTMRDDVDAQGRALPDALRLTRLGSFLRSTSLDELPSLWNVLRGDMSLIGPRPLLMHYLPRYSPRQRRRHEVRPGLTGWAQVQGRNALSWEDRLEMDVWYVEHRSFLLDLRIVWKTVRIVIRREGISQPGEATMKEFQGNDGD